MTQWQLVNPNEQYSNNANNTAQTSTPVSHSNWEIVPNINAIDPSTQGFSGVASDIGNSLLTAPGALAESLIGIPKTIENAGDYFDQVPPQQTNMFGIPKNIGANFINNVKANAGFLGNLGIGGLEDIAHILNIPSKVASYALAKGFNNSIPIGPFTVSPKTLKNTNVPIEDIEARLGIQPSSSSAQSVRNLTQLIPSIGVLKAPSLMEKMLGAAAYNVGAGGDPIHAALGVGVGKLAGMGANKVGPPTADFLKKVWNTQPLAEKAASDAATAAASQSALNEASARAPFSTNPEAGQVYLNKKAANIQEKQQKLSSLPEAKDNPVLQQMFPNMNPDERVSAADNMQNEAQTGANNADQALKDQMTVTDTFGPNHTIESAAGTGLQNYIKAIRDSYKPGYQEVNDDLYGLETTSPFKGATKNASDVAKDMLDTLPMGYLEDHGELVDALKSVEDMPEKIPATHLIQINRMANAAANAAIGKGNAYGVGAHIQGEWRQKAAQFQKLADRSREIMEGEPGNPNKPGELPPDTLEKYDALQKSYGENVMPFYRNGAFDLINKEGKIPADFMTKTAGNMPHQLIMQRAIMNNPNINRLVISQKYAKNPEGLLNPENHELQYIGAHRPISNLLDQQKAAHDYLNNIKFLNSKVKELHPQQSELFNKRQKLTNEINEDMKQFEIDKENHRLKMIAANTAGTDAERAAKSLAEFKRFEAIRKYSMLKMLKHLGNIGGIGLGDVLGGKILDFLNKNK